MPQRKSEPSGMILSVARELGFRPRADTLPGLVRRYEVSEQMLEIPLETVSKVAPTKLLWAMLHQIRSKPP
jgi:hypothetical protein